LLDKNWKANADPIIEIYRQPDQIDVLRLMLPIMANPSESQRLTDIRTLWQHHASPLFREEFLSALRDMRDRNNFEIAASAFNQSSPKDQLRLLEWLGDTGDARAVGILIRALNSPDLYVRSGAATKLIYYYPDAPGVTDAIFNLLKNGPNETKSMAFQYLLKRKSAAELETFRTQLPTPTLYQRAEEVRRAGNWKEAAPLYVAAIKNPQSDEYVKRTSATAVLPHLTPQQKAELIPTLLPMLQKDATSGNYLEAAESAEILRSLHHIQCLDSLIKMLDKREFIFDKSLRSATMAIRELGPAAKKKATQHLLGEIAKPQSSESQTRLLLSLAWLADDDDVAALRSKIKDKPEWQSAFTQTSSLLELRKHPDEAKFLINWLQTATVREANSREAKIWAIYRLGDLKDKRAATVLVEEFKNNKGGIVYVIDDAIKSIGGPEIERALEPLASSAGNFSQGAAINILGELQGARSLPLMRKVADQNSPAKSQALTWIGRYGTAEDLKYLLPMSDYWTGDRTNHYWYLQAISEIRQRL
jgi:HEAT repeat protein